MKHMGNEGGNEGGTKTGRRGSNEWNHKRYLILFAVVIAVLPLTILEFYFLAIDDPEILSIISIIEAALISIAAIIITMFLTSGERKEMIEILRRIEEKLDSMGADPDRQDGKGSTPP